MKSSTFLIIAILAFGSCKKPNSALSNHLPIADAGTDRSVTLPNDSIELIGSGTGAIVSYRWRQLSGPSTSTIINANSMVTKVKNLVQGNYQFELTIKDNNGLSAKDTVTATVIANKPPVANAGPDTTIILPCYRKIAFVELDGTGSADPDVNIISYKWQPLTQVQSYGLYNSTAAKAIVNKMAPGNYGFELTVTDEGGLSSKDTILITIAGPGIPEEYFLDITVNTKYNIVDNYTNPWEGDTFYYDETYFREKSSIQPFGEIFITVNEIEDSAKLNDQLYSSSLQINASATDINAYVIGKLSGINFKKLIRQNGGEFSGTWIVTGGSAEYCDANVFTNLPPLSVTGQLDPQAQTVKLNIKGKIFF